MGWREASMMRRQVLRVWGQASGSPSGVLAQLKARMAVPISPPPARNSGGSNVMRRLRQRFFLAGAARRLIQRSSQGGQRGFRLAPLRWMLDLFGFPVL